MDALQVNIRGIKCDVCDYINPNAKFEDYKQWLNKPCPQCGANLLTEKDLRATKALIRWAKIINFFLPKASGKEKSVKGTVEMNGTGIMGFKVKE